MAVVNTQSGSLANINGAPPKINDSRLAGKSFDRREVVTTIAGDSIASHYGFFRIPTSAILVSCSLTCDAMGGATAGDIGLWEVSNPFLPVTQAGSIANAKQYFGAAVSLVTAVTKQQQLVQASWTTPAKLAGKRIWEILGLASDPAQGAQGSVEYDIVLTLTAAVTTGGAAVLEIFYKMN